MHIGSGTDFEHLQHVCQAMEAAAKVVGDQLKTSAPVVACRRPIDQPISRLISMPTSTSGHKHAIALQKNLANRSILKLNQADIWLRNRGTLSRDPRRQESGLQQVLSDQCRVQCAARPILYGAYHPITIVRRDGQSNGSTQSVVVGGPLCESGDIFTQGDGGFVEQRELPTAKVGDLLVFGVAGAYGFVMSSNYNSYPLVSEVLLDKGSAKVIRKRQTSTTCWPQKRIWTNTRKGSLPQPVSM